MSTTDEFGQNASVGESTDENRTFHTGPNGESRVGLFGKASNNCSK